MAQYRVCAPYTQQGFRVNAVQRQDTGAAVGRVMEAAGRVEDHDFVFNSGTIGIAALPADVNAAAIPDTGNTVPVTTLDPGLRTGFGSFHESGIARSAS